VSRGWALALLLAGTFCLAAFFGRGAHSSVDEQYIFETTRSLVDRGSWQIHWRSEDPPDRTLSRFSPIPSLWAAPFYALARAVLADDPATTRRDSWMVYITGLSSCLATALTATILAAWSSRLGNSMRASIGCAWLYATGSLALPYSSTLFPQVTATVILLWCCRAVCEGRAIVGGIAFALAVWSRVDQVLLWSAFALAVWEQRDSAWKRMSAALCVGGLVGLAACLAVNALRGDPLFAGAYEHETFTTPFWIGLGGLMLSFGKGLLSFSPLTFIGLLGAFEYARNRAVPGRLICYLICVQLLILSKWWAWHGSWSWGPRLLLPILPLCMLPVAHWLTGWNQLAPISRRMILFISVASVAVNLWSATQPQIDSLTTLVHVDGQENEAYFVPHTSPFGQSWHGPAPWLWRDQSFVARAIGGALVILVPLCLVASLRASGSRSVAVPCDPVTMRQRSPAELPSSVSFGRPAVVAVFALIVAGNGPLVANLIELLADGPFEGRQYRQLARSPGGEYAGNLYLPLRGSYWFYSDREQPLSVRLGGGELFSHGPVGTVQVAKAGSVSVIIRGRFGSAGPLRWTIPGQGLYKQAIPNCYLLSPTPTRWQHFVIHWRHYGWLLWIPAALCFARWLLCDPCGRTTASTVATNRTG
jgi:hypothetical protein